MNLIELNAKMTEVERLLTSETEDEKAHGVFLLRDLIAISKPPRVYTLRPVDDDWFDNVPV